MGIFRTYNISLKVNKIWNENHISFNFSDCDTNMILNIYDKYFPTLNFSIFPHFCHHIKLRSITLHNALIKLEGTKSKPRCCKCCWGMMKSLLPKCNPKVLFNVYRRNEDIILQGKLILMKRKRKLYGLT